jgi:outer membrane lipoprotein-sorting protein
VIFFALLCTLAADPLAGILARMDQNAVSFKGVSADLKQVAHNAAVDIDNTYIGTILLKRSGAHDLKARIDFTQPDPKSISIDGEVVDIYYPKITTVQEYQVGKNRDLIEQFYLLGFGGSGKDLVKSYDVTYLGPETISGEPSSHLQLIPKSAQVLKTFRKVELWLSDATGYPLQQKVFQPSGDTNLLTYSKMKVNPGISDSALKLKLPKGVHKETPGR